MRLVFDIETNGIDFSDGNFLPQVHIVFCIVAQDLETEEIYKFYDTDGLRELGTGTIQQGLELLRNADELIGHNIIQFDLPVLRKLFGFTHRASVFDTLVGSRTLYPDRKLSDPEYVRGHGGHSLRDWGRRIGDSKGDHTDFTGFSFGMLEYCEQDVRLCRKVYRVLQRERAGGNWDRALETEHKIAEIIAEQERNGFYFNRSAAEQCVEEWKKEIDDIDRTVSDSIHKRTELRKDVKVPFKINGEPAKRTLDICEKFGIDISTVAGPFVTYEYVPFNLESPPQQKKILLELGWQPADYTPNGYPKIDESCAQVGEVGIKLLRRNILASVRSKVEGLLQVCDDQSRVHGGANPCGTNTARMRQSIIVNIPRVTSNFGKELRSFFTVPEGKRLVGYDAAGLELRILAHYIGNEEYNERVTTTDKTKDAHVLAAEAGGSANRDLGKTINYAFLYGAGDRKLGSIVGRGPEDGARIRRRLYQTVPGLERLVDNTKRAAARGYILTLDGRKLYLRGLVNPLNTLIQGGGAIFMKNVAVILDELVKENNLTAFKVVDMHDEAQWECPPEEVEALSSYIHEAFNRATSLLGLRCPQQAEVKVGLTWAETH